jgi:hypothetical protein
MIKPSKKEIKEYMEAHNADEVGINDQWDMEQAEYFLLNDDKYYYANKKKTYRLYIYWDGKGYVDIKADNREEAEDLFYNGGWDDTDLSDDSDSYCIEKIEEVKK